MHILLNTAEDWAKLVCCTTDTNNPLSDYFDDLAEIEDFFGIRFFEYQKDGTSIPRPEGCDVVNRMADVRYFVQTDNIFAPSSYPAIATWYHVVHENSYSCTVSYVSLDQFTSVPHRSIHNTEDILADRDSTEDILADRDNNERIDYLFSVDPIRC